MTEPPAPIFSPPIVFEPIGTVRSGLQDKADAPRQPSAARDLRGFVDLRPGAGFEDALSDVAEWEALWIVFVFDRARGWRPRVRPPRSAHKRGVFATRSPHRPNPIGISPVRLERVEGLRVYVRELDILDGTPVLDLKPYLPWADALPNVGNGWLASPEDPAPRWSVVFGAEAEAQLAFLAARSVALRRRIADHLALGPRPHAYRRIRADPSQPGRFVLSVKSWRVDFVVDERDGRWDVRVEGLRCGEKRRRLDAVQAAFVAAFGSQRD